MDNKAIAYLKTKGMEDRIREFDVSTATVELAAQALDCEPAHIAKTLSFEAKNGCILIACAGDMRIDNHKFKEYFHVKARMLSPEQVEERTGFRIGGVCPFGVDQEQVSIYLDESLRRFEQVFPACGTANSAVRLSPDELERVTGGRWIDVCKAF